MFRTSPSSSTHQLRINFPTCRQEDFKSLRASLHRPQHTEKFTTASGMPRCLFKQETSEGVRWPLWKRGRNPTKRQRNIARQSPIQPSATSTFKLPGFKHRSPILVIIRGILMLTLKQADVRLEYKARVRFALPYSWPNINWIVA